MRYSLSQALHPWAAVFNKVQWRCASCGYAERMSLTVMRPRIQAKSWRKLWENEESSVETSDARLSHRSFGSPLESTYFPLYRYLEDRFANTVVLTFAEIEDLLGFTLPNVARLDRAWWANDDANETQHAHSAAWRRAGRTATPNLVARTVAFERAQS